MLLGLRFVEGDDGVGAESDGGIGRLEGRAPVVLVAPPPMLPFAVNESLFGIPEGRDVLVEDNNISASSDKADVMFLKGDGVRDLGGSARTLWMGTGGLIPVRTREAVHTFFSGTEVEGAAMAVFGKRDLDDGTPKNYGENNYYPANVKLLYLHIIYMCHQNY
jgi:hypothetical protein